MRLSTLKRAMTDVHKVTEAVIERGHWLRVPQSVGHPQRPQPQAPTQGRPPKIGGNEDERRICVCVSGVYSNRHRKLVDRSAVDVYICGLHTGASSSHNTMVLAWCTTLISKRHPGLDSQTPSGPT